MQLYGLGTVVQPVVVETELAEGNETALAISLRASGCHEGGQVSDDFARLGFVDLLAVGDRLAGVRVTGRNVLIVVSLVMMRVGAGEDRAATGVYSCCCEDSTGLRFVSSTFSAESRNEEEAYDTLVPASGHLLSS